ncbi:sterol carrier protein 2 [Setaria viridis]|uniref:SCP2 domain-containing protein n=1 Tax=Setaria viridis TaxID=4556 RepID=A0A4U6UUL8_SETVI|nr:peroxisomal multifunctional enzyme type 2 [Setaria viridis]TKW20341.1 hypothetical protein SEVIR_4G081000v2 [Setaria viridis]
MDCLLLSASRDCSTSPQNRTSSPPLASPSCNLSLPVRLCAATRSSPAEMDGSSLKSAQLLEQMRLHMATDAGKELTKKVGLVYQLNIAPKKLGVDEEIFVVDLKKGEVSKGPYQGKPDATFSFTDNDFLGIASGKTNPQIAFIRGAIKIKGSIAAAQKFTPDIFPKPAKL